MCIRDRVYHGDKYPAKIEIEHRGPVRTVVRIRSRLHQACRSQKIILYDDLRRIDFETAINFVGKSKRFRVVFQPDVKGKAVHETPFYCAEREAGHWPVQTFVDVSDGDYGFALINAGNPGYEVTDDELSLVLFRSVSLVSKAYLKYICKNFAEIVKALKTSVKLQLSGLNILEYPLYEHHGIVLRTWATDGCLLYTSLDVF